MSISLLYLLDIIKVFKRVTAAAAMVPHYLICAAVKPQPKRYDMSGKKESLMTDPLSPELDEITLRLRLTARNVHSVPPSRFLVQIINQTGLAGFPPRTVAVSQDQPSQTPLRLLTLPGHNPHLHSANMREGKCSLKRYTDS